MPESGATSEQAYENFVSDRFDWGDRRDGVAWRWCQLWNRFSAVQTDCGPRPAGIPDDSS